MGKVAIQVDQLSKKYTIGKSQEGSLYHSIGNLFGGRKAKPEDFWALKDVSFNVEKGEVLGIIGKNGAGKSTLLKILSRITEPTSGRVEINGRVASLLEVGTGFHPELTGKENIFLNGSILGMKRQEINDKFDEIVDFSEIEDFIDTPVKHYSSGMYVRLAFSVAAYLSSEVLIIDEVLAVGDVDFQKKCLNTIDDINSSGRTVLLVSHNANLIKKLCNSCCLLKAGRLVLKSSVEECLTAYMKVSMDTTIMSWTSKHLSLTEGISDVKVKIINSKNNSFINNDNISVLIVFFSERKNPNLKLGIFIEDHIGTNIIESFQNDFQDIKIGKGENIFLVELPKNLFNIGLYYLSFRISVHNIKWVLRAEKILCFNIDSLSHNKSGTELYPRKSLLLPILKWQTF